MAARPLKLFLPTADEALKLDLPKLGEILLVQLRKKWSIHVLHSTRQSETSGARSPICLR